MRRRPPRDSALNRNFPDKCIYALLPAPNGCTTWNATREQRQESVHNEAKFMASYVTGSHNIKFGVENDWGPGRQRKNTRNGHLHAALQQQSAQPRSRSSTIRSSSPRTSRTTSASSLQDSWTIKRLTINPGLRVPVGRNRHV